MKTKHLRKFLRQLREEFPTSLPVNVRQVSLPYKEHGWTMRSGDHYEVRIRKEDPIMLQMSVLLHEWAHVRTYSTHPDHSAAWAAEYAQVTRWLQGECEFSPSSD